MKTAAFIVLFALISLLAATGQETPKIKVKLIEKGLIKIDGTLDEAIWETAESTDNFWQFFPSDSVRAKYKTQVRLLYDEQTIYAGIRAEVPGDKYTVASLRRDFRGIGNDNITLVFDTFSDGTNAFLFGMTPYGVQRDVLLSNGGVGLENFNTTWDTKWQVESRMYADHYILEAAIPFSSLKFREGESRWRLQTYRWDLQGNEQSAWARVPQNQLLSNIAFMGEMEFEKSLGKSRTPIAIIPYVNGLVQKDFLSGEKSSKLRFGGDAKVAIGNSMNLDITLNPDFSNVEVDKIFTNLTRFELFLPEKRQFFIDNSDLFSSFGSFFRDANPFFSRRIGLARNKAGNLIENNILGGVRLSGKIGQDWRLGFLDVQTDEDISNGIASNNNLMFALQKKVFSRSNIGVFVLNRQSIKDYDFLSSSDKYNRVVGIDYNMASADNTLTGKFYLHKSFQPGDSDGNLSAQTTATYNKRRFSYTIDGTYVDQDFRSDLGFVPRKGFYRLGNLGQLKFYPKTGIINTHNIESLVIFFWNPQLDYKKTDHLVNLAWNAAFKDQSSFAFTLRNNYVFLLDDFDPTRTKGGVPLLGNKGYTYTQVETEYRSNLAKVFSFDAKATAGQFFNGNNVSVGGQLSYRFQPWVSLNLAVNYDGIRLPAPHPDADLWLVEPKVDVTFSKSLFWSTLVQYSNQRENLGFNSRLQWRFAPLSDLYLVYNDNYSTKGFEPKFRSINLKLTYWLNI